MTKDQAQYRRAPRRNAAALEKQQLGQARNQRRGCIRMLPRLSTDQVEHGARTVKRRSVMAGDDVIGMSPSSWSSRPERNSKNPHASPKLSCTELPSDEAPPSHPHAGSPDQPVAPRQRREAMRHVVQPGTRRRPASGARSSHCVPLWRVDAASIRHTTRHGKKLAR